MEDIVREYLNTWNADAQARRRLIATHWSHSATYTDPMAEVTGHDGIDGVIGAVREQFDGFVFTRIGDVDAHHRQVRFRWGLGPVGGDPVVIGFDVLVVDAAGRIDDVRGFLDLVPA